MLNRIRVALKLFNQGYGEYRPQILFLTVLGFFSAFFEAVGINALIPLFSFATGGGERGTDIVSRSIEWFFSALHLGFNLKSLLVFIVLLFVLKALAKLLFNYIQIRITAGYEQKTRNKLFRETLNAKWSYLMHHKIGYLEKILDIDIAHSGYLLRYLAQIILLLTSLLIYTVAALNISLTITLSTFALGAILLFLFRKFVYKTRVTSQQYADVTKEVSHHINENMIGIKTVKAIGAEEEIIKKGEDSFLTLKQLKIKKFLLHATTAEIIEPVGLIFIVAVFAFSYKSSGFNFASFAVIIYLINRIFGYLKNAQMKMHSINEFIPYLKSSIAYQSAASTHGEEALGTAKFDFKNKLEFRNVKFSYTEREDKVLSKLNFAVKKGEMVGLIGPSGAGKTTIVDLLLRLFDPDDGQILLDEKDISKISLSGWRKNIGYVSQDIFLLNDTVENNIKFYSNSITKKDIVEASKMANIYKFISDLPQGFKTIIGERGVRFSGGQRQRVSLARVLARKPKILILDEATSALDNESEIAVQKAIESLKGKITVLVIAHRLSTIINSDRLIVLEKGKIVESGVPDELLKMKKSYFHKVYNIREDA